MQSAACFLVGKIVRKYSFKGEVIILVNSDYIELIDKMESVYIALGDSLVPFFIEKANWQKNLQFRVKFEDVNSEADADALVHKEVFLPNDILPEITGNNFYKDEIIGFKVTDKKYGNIGVVKNINDRTPQILLEVENKDGVVHIPVNDAFIIEIDRKLQTILVETPEGLLDLRL